MGDVQSEERHYVPRKNGTADSDGRKRRSRRTELGSLNMDWDYQKIYLNGHHRGGDDIELLSEAGRAGWELVTVTANSIAYLKHALEDDTGHIQQNEAVRP